MVREHGLIWFPITKKPRRCGTFCHIVCLANNDFSSPLRLTVKVKAKKTVVVPIHIPVFLANIGNSRKGCKARRGGGGNKSRSPLSRVHTRPSFAETAAPDSQPLDADGCNNGLTTRRIADRRLSFVIPLPVGFGVLIFENQKMDRGLQGMAEQRSGSNWRLFPSRTAGGRCQGRFGVDMDGRLKRLSGLHPSGFLSGYPPGVIRPGDGRLAAMGCDKSTDRSVSASAC